MSAGVAIVSFNTKDFLRRCLKKLYMQKLVEKIDIWVLDNNSSDGSYSMVEKEFPQVNLIKSDQNTGFAKGQNLILKKIKNEYALILNPDTEFDDSAVSGMIDFMERNPNCAIAGSKLTDFKNNLSSNGGDLPFGVALITWLFNIDLENLPNFHRMSPKYYASEKEVGWVGGTFMIVRVKLLEKIGFFDEDYFMYFEDVDLCFKAKKNGYKVMLNPKVMVKHVSGASSKDPKLSQWLGEFKGLLKFYRKNFGFLTEILIRILVYKAIALRALAFLILGNKKKALTYGKVLFNI